MQSLSNVSTLISTLVIFSPSFAAETITLDDVTVTAEHREQAVSKVAATIDVLGADVAADQRLLQLNDLNNLTSNLSVQPTGRFKSINIRGIGGGGTNAGFDTRVGVYVDGVYMGQAMALGNPIFDIQRVEVLKGPQGYLFGNNSDAGVVNIITKQPTHQRERSITSGIGNYGLFENTLLLNGELTDKLTARVTINNADRNGYVRNSYNNEDLKYLWRFASRAQIKLEASENLDINFSADYTNNHQEWFLHQPTSGLFDQPLSERHQFDQVNFNRTPLSRVEGYGFSLNANYYLENDAELTAIIAKRDWQTKVINDNDYSPVDLIYTQYDDHLRQYSQEFRYTSSDDIAWPFVVGLYFLQDKNHNDRFAFFGEGVNSNITLPGLPNPVPYGAVFGMRPNVTIPIDAQVQSNIKAIYTNVDHPMLDHFVLHLGGRYSIETKKLNYSIDGSQSGIIDMAVLDQERDKIRQTFFSPMIGLSYYLNENTQIYSKASRAYKSGGWNVDYLTTAQINDGFEYDPESVNAYEIGYKSQTDQSQVSIAAFANFYKDYQLFQFANLGGNTTVLQLRNAANVKAQGVEINYKRLLSNQWELDTKLAYLDARFQKFPGGKTNGADADGQRLPDAPRFSGSVTLNYQARLPKLSNPIKLSLQNNFQTLTYSGLGNEPETSKLASRFIFNAFANYTTADKCWSFQLWVRNLGNKQYALTRGRDFFGNLISTYALPRTYGLNGTYRF